MVLIAQFLAVLISIFSLVEPHAAGAPEAACNGMTPGHGLDPQPNDDSIPTSCTINIGKFAYIYIKGDLLFNNKYSMNKMIVKHKLF